MAEKDPAILTNLDLVCQQLAAWPAPTRAEHRIVVPTHCLFSSGSVVRVSVVGGPATFVVHDDGAAIDEFGNGGGVHPKSALALRRHFREQGILVTDHGEITSPQVPIDALAATIVLIANASQEAEELLHSRWKPRVRRDFKRMLRDILEVEFPNSFKPEVRIAGSSQKQHTFDFGLDTQSGGLLLVDAVHNDQNAISSAVLRSIDVRHAKRDKLALRIIYDDAEEWRAEDLNMLSLGGTVVSFTNASSVLHRLAA